MSDFTPITTAMVLAAGLGTRMRPITEKIPKPLVRVDGKTLLDHALDALANHGVKQASVNVHYLADQIESHVASRSQPEVSISDEREELLDSGGGVKQAVAGFPNGPIFILNADSFWIDGATSNLDQMVRVWEADSSDILLLVSGKETAVGFDGPGDFFMDGSGLLSRRGTASSAPFIYAGAIIAKAEAFRAINEKKFSINQMFDMAIEHGKLRGCVLDGLWLHVGTPEAIALSAAAILEYRKAD